MGLDLGAEYKITKDLKLSFAVLDGKLCIFSVAVFRQDDVLIYTFVIHYFFLSTPLARAVSICSGEMQVTAVALWT